MVYLDGDNNLEKSAIDNFIEMAAVGSDANLNIVVQFDRLKADSAYKDGRYGGWTTCKRFLVTQGMEPTADRALEDLGEVDMGNPATLQDFINWATAHYPADRYALILWNHGSGWYPYNPPTGLETYICQDDTNLTALSMADVKTALTGADSPVQLLGLDACLMNMIEVAYEFRNAGPTVMVGSEETEPGQGWPYHTILRELKAQPTWTASQLGSWIVDKYYESTTGSFKATTQSALDLTRMESLATGINELAKALRSGKKANNLLIQNKAQQVMAEIKLAVINNKCDTGAFPGANGLTIYFPQFQNEAGDLPNYNPEVIEFAGATTWKNFLQDYLNLMQLSWLSNIRWQTQAFSQESPPAIHVDLYDFCQRLAEAPLAAPDYFISWGLYDFQDLVGSGTKIDFSAQDYVRVSLPFPLVFCGKGYREISISPYGVIYFDDRSIGPITSIIPGDNDYGINTFIAPFWDNLNLTYDESDGVYYQVQGEAPRRSLIVQWKGMCNFGTGAFQALFYEGSRDMIFQYNTYNFGATATIGIQKDLFNGLQAFHNKQLGMARALQFHANKPAVTPILQILLLSGGGE